jgi:hypothetical protein
MRVLKLVRSTPDAIGNMWFIMFMVRRFEGERFRTFKAPQGGLFGGIGRER